jgi:hypothetical protein
MTDYMADFDDYFLRNCFVKQACQKGFGIAVGLED